VTNRRRIIKRRHAVSPILVLAVILAFSGCGRDGEVDTDDPKSNRITNGERPSVSQALLEVRASFPLGGEPIHPALVYEFMPWMSDSEPITVAVDVLPANNSDEYYEPAVRMRSGWIECDVKSLLPHCRGKEPTVNPPQFGYRRVGAMADGTQVLRTYYGMGGSGIFMNLLFIRFVTEKAYDLRGKPYPRLLMRVVCIYALGDRDDGEITVLSDRVIAGPSKHREKAVVIRLD